MDATARGPRRARGGHAEFECVDRRAGPGRVAPLRALFDMLRGPETGTARPSGRAGVFWRGRLVTAVDATILCCPDTSANLTQFSKGGSHNGGTGYPMVRVLALVACGTRTIIDAVFGTDRTGEIGYAHQLLGSTRLTVGTPLSAPEGRRRPCPG